MLAQTVPSGASAKGMTTPHRSTQRSDAGPTTGSSRERRRGLYGPPPRLTRTSPLTGRLLWHIGDWGRASEHIGARWEHVAGALAQERLGGDNHLIVLATTPGLLADVL